MVWVVHLYIDMSTTAFMNTSSSMQSIFCLPPLSICVWVRGAATFLRPRMFLLLPCARRSTSLWPASCSKRATQRSLQWWGWNGSRPPFDRGTQYRESEIAWEWEIDFAYPSASTQRLEEASSKITRINEWSGFWSENTPSRPTKGPKSARILCDSVVDKCTRS